MGLKEKVPVYVIMSTLGVMYVKWDDKTDKQIIFVGKYITGLAEADSIYTYNSDLFWNHKW